MSTTTSIQSSTLAQTTTEITTFEMNQNVTDLIPTNSSDEGEFERLTKPKTNSLSIF
jgi:hypothetical protein